MKFRYELPQQMLTSVLFLLVTLLLFLSFIASARAELTCSGVTNILGVEYVAECVDGRDSYRYVQTDILCESGKVVKGNSQRWMNGGTFMTPAYAQAAIVNSASFSSGRVFGNSKQSHYLVVTNTFAKYNGVLDGISFLPRLCMSTSSAV